jgi:hypothetical protein
MAVELHLRQKSIDIASRVSFFGVFHDKKKLVKEINTTAKVSKEIYAIMRLRYLFIGDQYISMQCGWYYA